MSAIKSERSRHTKDSKPTVPKDSNYVGEVLKEIRVQENLTQEEAAKLVGLSQAQWSAYEKGNSRLTLDIIIAIAEAFQMEPLALVGRSLDKFKFPTDPDRRLSVKEYESISKVYIEDYRNNRHEQFKYKV